MTTRISDTRLNSYTATPGQFMILSLALAVLLLLPGISQAGLIVEFQATVSSGTYNGNSIAGETLTATFNLGDAADSTCCGAEDQGNEFLLSDPAVTNTFNITGPNGGTFSQDVFNVWNWVFFNDEPGANNDQIVTRLGNQNSNHFTGTAEYLGPGDQGLDGTVPTLASRVILDNFAIGSLAFNSTTIQGGGNTLVLGANSFSNQSVTLTAPSAIPEPSALLLFALGLASLGIIGWRRRTQGVALDATIRPTAG